MSEKVKYAHCYINKQYVEGGQKRKKAYLRLMDSYMVIAILSLQYNQAKQKTTKKREWEQFP